MRALHKRELNGARLKISKKLDPVENWSQSVHLLSIGYQLNVWKSSFKILICS